MALCLGGVLLFVCVCTQDGGWVDAEFCSHALDPRPLKGNPRPWAPELGPWLPSPYRRLGRGRPLPGGAGGRAAHSRAQGSRTDRAYSALCWQRRVPAPAVGCRGGWWWGEWGSGSRPRTLPSSERTWASFPVTGPGDHPRPQHRGQRSIFLHLSPIPPSLCPASSSPHFSLSAEWGAPVARPLRLR